MTAPDGDVPLRQPGLARRHRVQRRGARPGRSFLDLVHPDSRERYAEVVERALAGRDASTHVELVLVHRARASRSRSRGTSAATFRDGAAPWSGGIYRDVTERKRVEEQLRRAERMQAAGRLAGGVAHEVNNMMTGVIGFSEFLLRSLDARRPPARRGAGDHQGRHPRRRRHPPAAGLHPPAVPPARGADINDVVLGHGEDAAPVAGRGPSCWSCGSGADAGEIRADRGQLEQVLINLVLNARDAIPDRGRVTIATGGRTLDEVYAQRHADVDVPPGRYVAAGRERHRLRHGPRGAGPDLRAVLHHQAESARAPASASRRSTAS